MTGKPSGGKHARDEYRRIAEAGTILRCRVGSTVHGLAIEGTDDEDQMGICLEPPEYVIGLQAFDQYIYRTQPEGHRSGPGDLDLTVYSLRKWMRLALNGNPTILLPLFVPDEEIITVTEAGRELRAMAPSIISRQAGRRFAGYLEAQRRSLLSHEGKGRDVTRPELIEAYGFDTKYCGHMVRLGLQGVELLETGRISLPVPEPHRTWIRELRLGQHTMSEALELAEDLERRITGLKRELLRWYLDANHDPETDRVYIGYDWSEPGRIKNAGKFWAPWTMKALLAEPPYAPPLEDLFRSRGIEPPELYKYRPGHADCGGFCVRAGQAQFALMLQVDPCGYREWEAEEQESRQVLGKDVSILRDRTGGTTTPLSLRSFRERIERQPSMFDEDDWGACGCDMDGETTPAGPQVRVPKVERWDGSGWVPAQEAAA